MVRHFSNETRAARALQCWQILIGCARRRETITYKMLAKILGFDRPGAPGTGVIGSLVGPIMFWCDRNELPALTSILVQEATGVPGEGFDTRGQSIPALQAAVYAYQWYQIWPPTVEELEGGRNHCGRAA